MAKKQRQAYTEDFRREAVRRADQPGNTTVSVARGLGLHPEKPGTCTNYVGGGGFADLQKKIASGEFDEADIEVLRERLIDAVEAMLGPLELLLVDVPGLSWLDCRHGSR